MNNLSVAIIIPVKHFNVNLKKCIEECLKLDYKSFEIIIFPDEPFENFKNKIKSIPTGPMGPAEKRDMALKHSQADIFAFIDDDAYPEHDWLINAVKNFQDSKVAAVGGPSITPLESPVLAHASGHIFSSVFISGPYTYRYLPQKKMQVNDYPSCNFIVRRSIFEKLGGFDSSFYPGEDTKLCLDITKKLGMKIIYDPDVLVYHFRRNLGPAHFRQVANYALHRGYFAKKFPETSRKIVYFIPSLFVLFVLIGVVTACLNTTVRSIYSFCLLLYFSIIFVSVLWSLYKDKQLKIVKKIFLLIPIVSGMFFTHICYGFFFLKGICSKKMKEEEN
ncbi:MAG: glycosyltransferase [Candidatus Omnitrophota bacterium]